MRTALALALVTSVFSAAVADAATRARYDLRLSGTQSVSTGGTGTLAAPGSCTFSRNETSRAVYRFRSTIRVAVRGSRPARSQATAPLAVSGSGTLDQSTTAAGGCAEPPAVHESCGSRANTARGVRAFVRLSGRGSVGFGISPGRPGDALFTGFGEQCGVLADRSGFTSPAATLSRPIAVARLFRRARTATVGIEESIAFVNVFTGEIQEATCDECVPRRTTTRWTLIFRRAG